MRLTHIFKTPNLVSKYLLGIGILERTSFDKICKSHRLMQQVQLISSSGTGTFNILPVGIRALEKLIHIINQEMTAIGCQRMSLSCLSSSSNWKKSNRWEAFGDELMKLRVSGSHYCLNPTHEEAVTSMVGSFGIIPASSLPIKLYQISTKFRDEPRPKFGLLRCREFLMKDLYTFHKDKDCALETYTDVCQAYENIFKQLDFDYIKARSSCGNIGGEMSHEYLISSNIGEDKIFISKDGNAWNAEYRDKMDSSDSVTKISAIEIGHTFFLGTHYSKIFKAFCSSQTKRSPLHMGCFGLGVTRILAACVEVHSTEDGIRWPYKIAPFKVCILPPKAGSNEERQMGGMENKLYDILENVPCLKGDIIIDDRTNRTIGKRLHDAKLIGYPIVLVIGKHILDDEPRVELLIQKQDKVITLNISEAVQICKNEFE